MTKVFKFTERSVKKLAKTKPEKRSFYTDAENRRFILQITKCGSITFYFRYWNGRYTEKHPIGSFPDIHPDDARAQASELAARLARGVSPKSKREMIVDDPLFGDMYEEFLKESPIKEKREQSTIDFYQGLYKNHLEYLKDRRLSTFTTDEIRSIRQYILNTAGKRTSNKCLGLLKSVFYTGERKGWKGRHPGKEVRKYKETRRDRVLQLDEIGPFIDACEAERDGKPSLTVDALLVGLFTGLRRENFCAGRWEQIDFKRRTWTFEPKDIKNDEFHCVYLSDYVYDLLEQRYEDRTSDMWIFPSWGKRGYLAEPKSAMHRMIRHSKINPKGLMVNSLRHTFTTYAKLCGFTQIYRKRLLGHSRQGEDVTDGYTHFFEGEVRAVFEQVSRKMLEVARGDFDMEKWIYLSA